MVEHVPRHEVIAKLGKFRRYRLNQRQERNNAGIAQLVEHDLAKVGVASSNLVSRSKLAEWQNGYAADCKSVDLGSTPGSASISCLAASGSTPDTFAEKQPDARVVKLVDTRDLKSLAGNSVPVQVRPRAPFHSF